MTVIHPCDDLSAEELTVQLLDIEGPSYMRTARNKVPRMYDEESKLGLSIGVGSVLEEGDDVAIIACGVMVEQARNASAKLAKEGIDCTVVDMHTIKPLDMELLARLAERCGCFVSAEDHSVIGGLGSAISEWLSTNKPIPLEMVGVWDRFGESGGTSELMEEVGLTSEAICRAARNSINRKNSS
jgi:transketolase